MLKSEAWQSLSTVERALWIEIMLRFTGYNNGRISLSCREAAGRLRVSKNTTALAFQTLIETGFIQITAHSGFNMKQRFSRRWAVTHLPIEMGHATNEWKKFRKQS